MLCFSSLGSELVVKCSDKYALPRITALCVYVCMYASNNGECNKEH